MELNLHLSTTVVLQVLGNLGERSAVHIILPMQDSCFMSTRQANAAALHRELETNGSYSEDCDPLYLVV